ATSSRCSPGKVVEEKPEPSRRHSLSDSQLTTIQHWRSAGWLPPGATVPSHHGFLMPCICHRTSLLALACGKNPLRPIALLPTRRAPTLRCGIVTPLKQRNCTRSITWLTPIYKKG